MVSEKIRLSGNYGCCDSTRFFRSQEGLLQIKKKPAVVADAGAMNTAPAGEFMERNKDRRKTENLKEREIMMFQLKEKSREVTNMSEVKEQPLNWLWYPYIPSGKITVIHGVPDSGKTMFAYRLMAAFTTQKNLEGMEEHPLGNVLYFSADDDLSDMVRPRLIESGADLSRIFAVNDMLPFTLADDSIEKLIEDYKISMMIVDPIQEYLEYEVYGDEPELIYSNNEI